MVIKGFGEKLKAQRIAYGLSQKQLAKELNVKRVNITNYELGKRMPSYDTLIKLANFFNVSIDYLLGLTDNLDRS